MLTHFRECSTNSDKSRAEILPERTLSDMVSKHSRLRYLEGLLTSSSADLMLEVSPFSAEIQGILSINILDNLGTVVDNSGTV